MTPETNLKDIKIYLEIDGKIYVKDYSDIQQEFEQWCNRKSINNMGIYEVEMFLEEKDFDRINIIEK